MTIRGNRIFFLIIAILIAVLALPYLRLFFNQEFNLLLSVFVVSAFFLDFAEFLIILFFGLAFLAWQPQIDFALLVMAFLPFIAFWLKSRLPFRKGLNFFADSFIVFLAFYILVGWGFLENHPGIFVSDFIVSFLFGSLIFVVLYYLDEKGF